MKKTTEQFIQDSKNVHGNKYDYSFVVYNNATEKVKIICPKHGVFEQNRKTHISSKCGCPSCGEVKRLEKSKQRTKQFALEFEKKARMQHGNRFDYSKVNYIRVHKKVTIICPTHGEFLQRPNDHLTGYGCPGCGNDSTAQTHTLSTEQFIEKAKQKHGNKYDYSLVKYKGTHQRIKIICPTHGTFIQIPRQHLRGSSGGCKRCAGLFKDTNDFISEAIKVHGNTYGYDLVQYVNVKTRVTLRCKIHGPFEQFPTIHLNRSGCPKCCLQHHSKKAIDWLESISTKESIFIQHFGNLGEYKIPKTRYTADGFCSQTNTIYEFHGDVFHGNPEIFKPSDKCHPFNKHVTSGQLLKRTRKKEDLLKRMGYNVVIMWESTWDTLQEKT